MKNLGRYTALIDGSDMRAAVRDAKHNGANWTWLLLRPLPYSCAGQQAQVGPTWKTPEVITIARYNQGIGCTILARQSGLTRSGFNKGMEYLGIRKGRDVYHAAKRAQGAVTEGRRQSVRDARLWVKESKAKLRDMRRRMRLALNPLKTAKRATVSIKVYHRTKLWKHVTTQRIRGNNDRISYGCTIAELRKHIEAQWQPGMTWENHAVDGWHIDHIRPCASFNFNDLKQIRDCFHYTNLQPLWATENHKKYAKWSAPTPAGL